MLDSIHQPFPMLPGRAAQVWRHQPAYHRPRHFHAEPEINVVFRGWARMGVGTREIVMGPGDLIFLKPAQDHVMLQASHDLELFVLAATPTLTARFATGALPVGTSKLSLGADEQSILFDELLQLGDLSDAQCHERSVGRLFEWALPRHRPGHAVARKGLDRLFRNPALSAAEISRAIGSSPAELSRHFSTELGVRFVEARARVRLMRFIASVDSGVSFTAAAVEHFGSYAQCHRTFRGHLGCSPREYFKGARSKLADARFDELAAHCPEYS